MNENDMSNLMNQFNQMLKNNDIPSDFKNIIENFKNSSNATSENGSSNNASQNSSNGSKDSNTTPEIDINTILKMKQIMDSINSNKDDPRTNLLLSLKPYLKNSRKEKIDQYIKLFGIGKAFETFSSLGGENKHDV